MMKSIKKCLSGKLLKQSFIILLIGCFTLLVNSSVSAEMTCESNLQCSSMDFGDYRVVDTTNGDLQMGTINDSNFNFGDNYFSYIGSTRYSTTSLKLLYWWESDGLHYSSRYYDNSHGTNGKITGFYVCSQFPYIQSSNPTLASYGSCVFKDYSNMDTFLEGVNKYSLSCGSSLSSTNCIVCAFNSDTLNYVCVDNATATGIESEFLGIDDIESRAISNPFVEYSDSSNVPNTGGMSHYYPNNQNIYDSLYRKGYRSQLCYGGFELDDLFGTGNSSFYDIQAGSGANVNELYNIYGGDSDFITWYDNNYLDYLYLESFRDEYEYSKFIGKSRGLVGLGIVRSTFFKGDNFDTSEYKLFCNLVLNDLVDVSDTSPISIIDNTLSESLISDIVSSIGPLIPISGSALDIIASTFYTGDLSACMSGDDLSACFKDPIDSSWRAWSLNGIKEDAPGILPGYIVWGFLGILLLYYLRR